MTMSRKGRELLRLALPFVHAEIHRLSQVLPERGPTKYYLYLVYVYTHTHTPNTTWSGPTKHYPALCAFKGLFITDIAAEENTKHQILTTIYDSVFCKRRLWKPTQQQKALTLSYNTANELKCIGVSRARIVRKTKSSYLHFSLRKLTNILSHYYTVKLD